MAQKTLYRSTKNKQLAGVIGGMAEYFETDANLLRLISAAVIVFSGIFPGVILYLIAAVIVPQDTQEIK